MNRIKMGVLMLSSLVLVQVQALTLVEARAKIGAAVNDAKVMAETTAALNAADQVAFLRQVNEAIGKMPGSDSERTAKFYAANKAALTNAKKGNLSDMLAETFATVSPEALTVINERFAQELFSRSAGSGLTDAQFEKIAKTNMAKIEKRTAGESDADARNTFAILMFVRASKGSPANLPDTLVDGLANAAARQTAKTEWIPAALGKDQPKDYSPLLGTVEAVVSPVSVDILNVGPNAGRVSLLAELAAPVSKDVQPGRINNPAIFGGGAFGLNGASDGLTTSGINRVPRWVGPNDGIPNEEPDGTYSRDPGKLQEPRGYQNQVL